MLYLRNFLSRNRRIPALYLAVPLGVFLFLTFVGIDTIDRSLAEACYRGGRLWIVGKGFWAETVIHQWGKLIPVAIGTLSLFLWILLFTAFGSRLKTARSAFLYLTLSIIVCTLLVVGGKSVSPRFCPSNTLEFGGTGLGAGHCYPAGHAGAGFCLFGLYFLCRKYFPRKTLAALAFVMTLGLIFGITRQLQGAHFLSHTLATLSLDWFTCALLYFATIGRHELCVRTLKQP